MFNIHKSHKLYSFKHAQACKVCQVLWACRYVLRLYNYTAASKCSFKLQGDKGLTGEAGKDGEQGVAGNIKNKIIEPMFNFQIYFRTIWT